MRVFCSLEYYWTIPITTTRRRLLTSTAKIIAIQISMISTNDDGASAFILLLTHCNKEKCIVLLLSKRIDINVKEDSNDNNVKLANDGNGRFRNLSLIDGECVLIILLSKPVNSLSNHTCTVQTKPVPSATKLTIITATSRFYTVIVSFFATRISLSRVYRFYYRMYRNVLW